ncbi:MAG: hypothetical protein RLZZ43_812 [Actinomycetota bacterium]
MNLLVNARDAQPRGGRITVRLGPAATAVVEHPDIGGDHASEACFLTSAKHPTRPGFRNSVSLDVFASRHVAGATRFPLMTLSTQDSSPLSYTATGAGIPAMSVPSQIYARMFLAGSQGDVQKELERLRRGRSMLDRMRERLTDLNRSVSPLDRQQIADYTEAVRELEKQLVSEEAWVNRPKPVAGEPSPTENFPSPFADRSNSIGRAKVLFQLARLALQSDSTRIVTIFIRCMDEKPPIPGIEDGHHNLSHHGRNPAKIQQLKVIEKSKMSAFRDLLVSLRGTREGGYIAYLGIEGTGFDRIILDLPEPWNVVPHAIDALLPGGLLVAYTPSITQAVKVREAMKSGWIEERTLEVLHRTWHIEGQAVRPDHRMVAHTAFLTVARYLG